VLAAPGREGEADVNRTLKRLVRQTGLRRASLASARMCCERNMLATIGKRSARPAGRILCYHSVGQPLWGVNDVSPIQFRHHLEMIHTLGYRVVPASEIVATGGGPKDVAITFDDGLMSVATTAAPILADYGVPWSLFVVSEWAEGRHAWDEGVLMGWREIERLMAAGAEIGSHSATHPDFRWLGPDAMLDELARSRQTIEQRLGITPTSFAIPWGQAASWSAAATAAARGVGYATIYAQVEDRRPARTTARSFVTRWDRAGVFRAMLEGAFDGWEEWV
jgi:peptidoglycan/xylan/chitin deacetylase (PgdA/CDA1 family)